VGQFHGGAITPNPMTIEEAQRLLGRLIRGWLEDLRASGA